MARIADDTRGTAGGGWRVTPVPPAPFSRRSSPVAPTDAVPFTARTISLRCSGVVPQQPPTIRTPYSCTNSPSIAAIGAGSSGYTASPTPVLSGSPAFGITEIGRVACSVR